MRSMFFHEDDSCQVELLPVDDQGYCLREMGRIGEFADAHQDGLGFTDLSMLGEPPRSLDTLGVSLSELRSTIGAILPPFDQVFTGYRFHRKLCHSVHAWGVDDSAAVFAGVGEAGVIRSVWLSLYGILPDGVGEWSRLLRSLPCSPR